jgi:hypothetical protein
MFKVLSYSVQSFSQTGGAILDLRFYPSTQLFVVDTELPDDKKADIELVHEFIQQGLFALCMHPNTSSGGSFKVAFKNILEGKNLPDTSRNQDIEEMTGLCNITYSFEDHPLTDGSDITTRCLILSVEKPKSTTEEELSPQELRKKNSTEFAHSLIIPKYKLPKKRPHPSQAMPYISSTLIFKSQQFPAAYILLSPGFDAGALAGSEPEEITPTLLNLISGFLSSDHNLTMERHYCTKTPLLFNYGILGTELQQFFSPENEHTALHLGTLIDQLLTDYGVDMVVLPEQKQFLVFSPFDMPILQEAWGPSPVKSPSKVHVFSEQDWTCAVRVTDKGNFGTLVCHFDANVNDERLYFALYNLMGKIKEASFNPDFTIRIDCHINTSHQYSTAYLENDLHFNQKLLDVLNTETSLLQILFDRHTPNRLEFVKI